MAEEHKTQEIVYIEYSEEKHVHMVKRLMEVHLSEPYPVYTYRYFLSNWPKLCLLVRCPTEP